jgi:hypothetical protein
VDRGWWRFEWLERLSSGELGCAQTFGARSNSHPPCVHYCDRGIVVVFSQTGRTLLVPVLRNQDKATDNLLAGAVAALE